MYYEIHQNYKEHLNYKIQLASIVQAHKLAIEMQMKQIQWLCKPSAYSKKMLSLQANC